MSEPVDLLGRLELVLTTAREQARLDRTPCPDCGGDRLRSDFTGSGRCHAKTTGAEGSDE